MISMMVSLVIMASLSLADNAWAAGNRDVILVLDTSISMIGKGDSKRNIFPEVKGNLAKLISQLEIGDSVTFMTFDEKVNIYPVISIASGRDKDILQKTLSMIEANGNWTYTMDMIRKVFRTAEEMKAKSQGRETVIFILTDASDCPPPKGEKFNIKDVAAQYQSKDWHIFLVNLVDLKKNKRLAKLEKDISGVSPYTKTILAGDKDNLKGDMDKSLRDKAEREKTIFSNPLFIGGIILLLGLIGFIFYKRAAALKVVGVLEYWNNSVLDPYLETYSLTRHHTREILVGKSAANLNIRDIEIGRPFVIRAERIKGGAIVPMIKGGADYTVEFVNRETGEYLQNGDIFKVNNYTFKYIKE